VTAVGVAARLTGLLAAGLAVALAWIGLVALGGGSVSGSVDALAGTSLLRADSLAAAATGAAPLLLAGLAIAIGLRAGVVNLGVQGQALVGALAALLVQQRLLAPPGLVLAVSVAAAMAAGLAWALLPALLLSWRGLPEALTTVLGSFVAVALVAALPLAGQPAATSPLAGTGSLAMPLRRVADGAAWPSLVTWTVPVALLGAVALALVLRATRVGPRLRAMLDEPRAALLAGVRPGATTRIALLLSAAVAGLVGLQDTLAQGAPVAGGLGTIATSGAAAPLAGPGAAPVAIAHLPDYGLLAVAVVLVGRASGLGMVVAAFALELLDRAGAAAGPAAGLSTGRVVVLQVVLVVAAVLAARVVRGVTASHLARSARRPARKGSEPARPVDGPVEGPVDGRLLEPTIDDATEGAHA